MNYKLKSDAFDRSARPAEWEDWNNMPCVGDIFEVRDITSDGHKMLINSTFYHDFDKALIAVDNVNKRHEGMQAKGGMLAELAAVMHKGRVWLNGANIVYSGAAGESRAIRDYDYTAMPLLSFETDDEGTRTVIVSDLVEEEDKEMKETKEFDLRDLDQDKVRDAAERYHWTGKLDQAIVDAWGEDFIAALNPDDRAELHVEVYLAERDIIESEVERAAVLRISGDAEDRFEELIGEIEEHAND